MAKKYLAWKTKKNINELDIGYMINPNLHINIAFKEQVIICMNNTFGATTQPFIKNKMTKKVCFIIVTVSWFKNNKA